MRLAKRFDFHIREAIVAELQMNPYKMASSITQKPHDDPDTIEYANQEGGIVQEWAKNLRNTSYIFGDTYKGMHVVEAIRTIISEGFDPVQDGSGHKFQHELLGITAYPRCDKNSLLTEITLDVALKVHVDRVNGNTCCGLGLKEPNVIGNILYTKITATGGFKAKMFVLRSMADITGGDPS
jgi:hypothetical protein